MCTPLCGVAFILTLFLRAYSLNRKTVQGGDAKAAGDAEKGAEASSDKDEEDGTQIITRTNTIAAAGGSDKDKETSQV
jgi:hypothetical protein